MNSTPLMPSRTILVMALEPPPPIPIDFILAGAVEKVDFAISFSLLISLLLISLHS
jgi:hypothetical protein